MHKELTKQVNTVDFAENFKEDYIKMLESNTNLKLSNSLLREKIESKERKLELKFESKTYDMEINIKKKLIN